MVDVKDANITSTKNTVDHSDANGIPLKISGNVTKTSEGPSDGWIPALNTAGKITRPASIDTSRVSNETFKEVATRLLFFLKKVCICGLVCV